MYFKYPDIKLYNLSDPFYNDICNIFTSEVNRDMSLNDRRNDYINMLGDLYKQWTVHIKITKIEKKELKWYIRIEDISKITNKINLIISFGQISYLIINEKHQKYSKKL